MEICESYEPRFEYHVDIPDLRQIASNQVAFTIWQRCVPHLKLTVYSRRIIDYANDRDEIVENLHVPQSIKTLLRKTLTCIVFNVGKWFKKLNQIANMDVYDPNWCVLLADGGIDLKSSARKILSSESQLNDWQKFAIMGEFCLEDEIVKFPIDSLTEISTARAVFKNNHVVQYWYHCAKNNLLTIDTTGQLNHLPMAMGCNIENWAALEYFWNRLNADEQLSVAKSMFDNGRDNWHHLEKILGMMAWEPQSRLLTLHYTDIIRALIANGDSLRCLAWAWTNSKDLISIENFTSIVGIFLEYRLSAEEWVSWFVGEWDSFSNQYKIHAAEATKNELLTYFSFQFRPSFSAFILLNRILSHLSAEVRRNLILKYGEQLGSSMVDRSSMDELVKLCLPNAEDEENFKRMILNYYEMINIFAYLLESNNSDRLNMILNFCLATPKDVRKFKKKFLKSGRFPAERFIYDADKWNIMCEFIRKSFRENEATESKVKKQLVLSCVRIFPQCKGSEAYNVIQLMRIVESEFSEDDVEIIKLSLLHSFHLALLTNHTHSWYETFFNKTYFHRFVKWCVGYDKKAVRKYANGTFVDAVFNGVFDALDDAYRRSQCEGGPYRDESLLFKLNECLLGYLNSERKVKKYKLKRVIEFVDSKISFTMDGQHKSNYEGMLQILSKWFFEDDESAAREFEMKMHKEYNFEMEKHEEY